MDAVNIQTKFGLGEIVTTHQRRKGNQIIHDQIGTVETWAKKGGYQGADDRERIWFSPHCLRPELETQMSPGF